MCEVGRAGAIKKEMRLCSAETKVPRLLSKGKKRNKGTTVDGRDVCVVQNQLP